ncbi:metalloregulator ArsR/SmtB family transcription factor [Candidatus Micrarchaeota archaeon]|nr:metalloregulator ArsR/SmtB family transcription factor [Candidatus Micrarchaeota archaeon]MBU1930659.1 metalloregulator ArsR/SmtB family transcription factor [Candidatus Micrarchaeota archaeon]
MKERPYASCLKAIANDLRIQTLRALEEKPCSVQELCKIVRGEQSKVSHALQILRHCNFVEVHTEGRQRIYSLNPKVRDGLKLSKKRSSANLFHFLDHHMSACCDNQCERMH